MHIMQPHAPVVRFYAYTIYMHKTGIRIIYLCLMIPLFGSKLIVACYAIIVIDWQSVVAYCLPMKHLFIPANVASIAEHCTVTA